MDGEKLRLKEQQKKSKLDLSVVVPLMNEEENVNLLYQAIDKVLSNLGKTYEIIFIDDGSTDSTYEHLLKIHRRDSHVKIIKFRANSGQSAAMDAGFEYSNGKIIITMDGDLQNDPEDIPNLLEKLNEGYDVVSGWRKNRKDALILRKIPSRIANRIICSITKVNLHDTGCALKAYRADVIKRINLYGELHRFLPALARIEGAQIAELVVNHHPRKFGKSKYNITRTFRVIMDLMSLNLFIKYLKKPLYFFGGLGILFIFLGVMSFLVLVMGIYRNSGSVAENNILFTLTLLFFASGFQFLFIGLIANLIYITGKKKRLYLSHLVKSF